MGGDEQDSWSNLHFLCPQTEVRFIHYHLKQGTYYIKVSLSFHNMFKVLKILNIKSSVTNISYFGCNNITYFGISSAMQFARSGGYFS